MKFTIHVIVIQFHIMTKMNTPLVILNTNVPMQNLRFQNTVQYYIL